MSKLEEMQSALDLLKGQDVDALKTALALIGEPIEQTSVSSDDFEIGKNYFIRAVTFYVVGRVTKVTKHMVHFDDASWIADTGRFADSMKNGTFTEIEPVGKWFVGIGAIVDGGEFKHSLPTKQK